MKYITVGIISACTLRGGGISQQRDKEWMNKWLNEKFIFTSNKMNLLMWAAVWEHRNPQTFPGLVERRLGWNGLDPCHAFLWGCVLPVGLLVSNADRGGGARSAWRSEWVESKCFVIIRKHLLLFFPLSFTCSLPPSVLMTKNRATPIPSVGFVFVVSFPANFCFCWLCCAGWSSCSPHLTSCHYTEMLDISDDS